MMKKRLGDLLKERGKIGPEDLDSILGDQQSKSVRLGELLLERGIVSKEDIASALEEVNQVPYVECPPPAIEPSVLELIPSEVAVRCCALPLECNGKKLIVAMAEPQNLRFLDELRFASGLEISPRFGFLQDVLEGIRRFYRGKASGRISQQEEAEEEAPNLVRDSEGAAIQFFTSSSRETGRQALRELQAGMKQRTPAVRIVSRLLAAAASKNASDLHIEPYLAEATVRMRVDGVLRELSTIPAEQQAAVISRVKILADMDIAERRVPQDGRFLMQYGGRKFDLRISTLPTHFGEKVVIRLLDPTSTQVGLEQLGLEYSEAVRLRHVLSLPQGVLLVTGPTGSGKSTTLYSVLNLLRTPGRNIVTVEDPIEYMVDGISQVQVNPQAGLTFAGCLRSILRQDPDVIMVGEVRDVETAEIALKAAQTGHLVFSTLHTNDSVSAIARLLDLGVPSYLVASSLTAIMSQRLVRRLCNCRQKLLYTPENTKALDRLLSLGMGELTGPVYRAVGCAACDHTGYRGRIGVFELLLFDDPIREAIHVGARPESVRRLVRVGGFKSMQESALEKLKLGLTSPEEILRVVPCETSRNYPCEVCSRELLPAFRYCPYCGTPCRTDNLIGPELTTLAGLEKT
ncbi:MAG: Flp pilus assembly complex ATPase component TadA [Acidobacteria bacterium]|nr:Flp pilus assembly complex ATPase component TadA [Acidobacteriota bacterium]